MNDSTTTDNQPLDIRSDFYWALVPEWVLYADITAHAVRLYAVLARHADKTTGRCHPTRATLAGLMRTSRATVDRALEQLRQVGAVEVRQRKSEKGDWTSNVYLVRTMPPKGVSSPVTTPLLTGDETGLLTGDEQTRVNVNESHERRARKPSDAGVPAAKRWWEAQDPKPAGKRAWHALRSVCNAVAERGWSTDDIVAALERINAVPSVAQLDRELRSPRPETFAARKTREEREAREAAERRAEQQRLETERRLREMEQVPAWSCEPPQEFRERAARLRGRSAG